MSGEITKIRRREFLKNSAAAALGAFAPACPVLDAIAADARQVATAEVSQGVLSGVKPMIGTGWRGHMFPGAVAPFGLVQLSPDTSGGPEPSWNIQGDWYGWDHCSGYHYPDNVIIGFSHTHVQGTGGVDLGDVLVMPVVEGKNWSWDPGPPPALAEMQTEFLGQDSGWIFDKQVPGYRSFFSHQREEAKAGYYKVYLDTPEVTAELTATPRCGMHRYAFPKSVQEKSKRAGIMLDLVHGLGSKVYSAELNIESTSRLSGSRFTHGWSRDKQVYFVIEVSRPAAMIEAKVDGSLRPTSAGAHISGKEIKALLSFASSDEPLLIRVGISCTGIEGAARNLAAEIPHWNFDAVMQGAAEAWSNAVSVLSANLREEALTESFETGIYHSLVAPATFNDVNGAYRGQDRVNHANPGFVKYTTLSIWDIYRGEFPFIMLMQPHRTCDIVRTLMVDYSELGEHALPMWPLWGNETWSMTGFHAAGMILGAYTRGFRDFDAKVAYAAIRDTALVGAAGHSRELQAMFRQYGYVPMDMHGGSVSCTLDLAYDYWCAGAMAELLGNVDDAKLFYKLGQNYRNVYDSTSGFMRGKTKAGSWRDPFRPDQEYDDYVETDAWQASFSVPHDVQGLIELHGGDAAFIAKLDGLFTAPSLVLEARPDITGMTGQNAQGDEPSNHNAYLFPFAGAAWKTQYWVRKVASLYRNTPQGIPGNDDCGQLSSWFVFAALGFYPVNAATGVYVLGSPLVNRAVIRNPESGTRFTIIAENNSQENVYIQKARMNGKELSRSWITHEEITGEGELQLEMSSVPNKEWATDPHDRPPSGLIGKNAVAPLKPA